VGKNAKSTRSLRGVKKEKHRPREKERGEEGGGSKNIKRANNAGTKKHLLAALGTRVLARKKKYSKERKKSEYPEGKTGKEGWNTFTPYVDNLEKRTYTRLRPAKKKVGHCTAPQGRRDYDRKKKSSHAREKKGGTCRQGNETAEQQKPSLAYVPPFKWTYAKGVQNSPRVRKLSKRKRRELKGVLGKPVTRKGKKNHHLGSRCYGHWRFCSQRRGRTESNVSFGDDWWGGLCRK